MFTHTAGPHTALIKSSGPGRNASDIVIGGSMFVVPILQRVDRLDLRLRTITVHTLKGTSARGVAVDVTSCCQVKVQGWSPDEDGKITIDIAAVRLAAQHFVGKRREKMNEAIQRTIAGHQRAIIGTLTIEELYRDRAAFSRRVTEVCSQDLRDMGLVIVSYTVQTISDENKYIQTLGVTQTENVKREAKEGAAKHISLGMGRQAELQAEAEMKINSQKERVLESDKVVYMRRADAEREVRQANAIQKKAGQIKDAEMNGILRVKRQDAAAVETEAETVSLALRVENARLEKILNVTVPADAELYRRNIEADITRELARARAQRIQKMGEAEAEADRARGKARMEVLQDRVKVWMNSANLGAVMEVLIDTLPAIAAEIAAPLANAEKIVFVGGSEEEPKPPQFETNGVIAGEDGTIEDELKGLNMDRVIRASVLGSSEHVSVDGAETGLTAQKLFDAASQQ